jgi:hypothetical protein
MIRSITLGVPLSSTSLYVIEETILKFHMMVMAKIAAKNWLARTVRITLPPLTEAQEAQAHRIPAQINSVSRIAEKCGIRWFCLPLDLVKSVRRKERLRVALESLLREQKMFLNLMVADADSIGVNAVHDSAKFILNLSRKSNNGFDNFRVGVSCNCPPNAPFFPFSRHEGEGFRFSFALETTAIALSLSEQVNSGQMTLQDFCTTFITALTTRLKEINAFGQELALSSGLEYAGLDAALAPLPDGKTSIGKLLENLGASPAGCHGTLFLTSLLTDAIRASIQLSQAKVTGFNGVMFSLLEDDYLAKANNRRGISIASLNAYASLCGCGLDMVPVPGITFQEDITAIILDIAALAVRLQKPLGARILPIPNKTVNELTELNLDFLCDSRVMEVFTGDSTLNSAGPVWQYAHH